jgi:hypothetical protein
MKSFHENKFDEKKPRSLAGSGCDQLFIDVKTILTTAIKLALTFVYLKRIFQPS